ncbi:MAG: DUF3352 domain-containing protein [Bacteroidales bacterium]|nr:DUF3352 domain-containing protein [Bacteroidales bacterium]
MKKKILIISGIILFATLLTIGLIYIFKPGDKISRAIDAVPGNPSIVIEVSDIKSVIASLKTENLIFNELKILFEFSSTGSIVHCYDSLSSLKTISEANKSGNTVICFDRSSGQFSQILYKEFSDENSDNSFLNSFTDEIKSGGNIKEREYKNVIIHEYNSKNGNRFFYCVKNHLLIVSFTSVLIEKSLDNLSDGQPIYKRDKGFAEVYETAGKKEIANVFVNMEQLAQVISISGSEAASKKIGSLKHFSGWIGLDMNNPPDMIKLNGFIHKSDSAALFTTLISSQSATNINCLEIIPDNTAMYCAFAFNNSAEFDKNLNAYLKLTGTNATREKQISDIKSGFGIDPKSFYELFDNEICISAFSPVSIDEQASYFTIAGLNSQSNGILGLESILKSCEAKTGKSVSDFKSEIKIDDNTKIVCYSLPITNLPEVLFGPSFSNCKSDYVCFIKNYMVFSDSKEALHKFAYDAFLNKTMATSIEHNLFLENFSDKSMFFAFFSFGRGYNLAANTLSEGILTSINKNRDAFTRLGLVGYQINSANGLLYNNFVIKHSDDVSEKPQTVWESRLENPIFTKPALVINHNDNSKEILIQDEKNILYLLSNSGREVWRLQLDEQITGKIYQIDMYKNGKLQYLFSSANKIHVIDRLGNYIEKFPVSLRAEATAPLALFDYENNKNYRILIPCADKKVYLYDAEGSIVKGWNFNETENKVEVEAAHYQVGSEDYIVFHDDYKCYFLNRSGEPKTEILTSFKFSKKNKIWYDNTASKPGFVTTDASGTVWYLYVDGTKDSIKIKSFSENHWFALEDINADGKSDFIFADGKKLEVYNKSKKLILSCDFEGDISAEPLFYKFPSNQNKIGIVCKSVSKIYLINSDGSYFNGFPLHGLTPFSIGYLNNSANKFNLLVGGAENLLYNYEVNEN